MRAESWSVTWRTWALLHPKPPDHALLYHPKPYSSRDRANETAPHGSPTLCYHPTHAAAKATQSHPSLPVPGVRARSDKREYRDN